MYSSISKRRLQQVGFAVIPLLALVFGLELIIRILDADRPRIESEPLPEELFGAIQPDSDLFWSGRPDARIEIERRGRMTRINTNSLGLRSSEIGVKPEGEFRILSLGESSTFGAYVSDFQTYSTQLERLLNGRGLPERVRVINAGVSAYSSFQSLLYLKQRGFDLEPDVVLFYHEYNDYLPSTLRASGNSELGMSKTDKELHASLRGRIGRQLLAHSAIYRFLSYTLASYRIQNLQRGAKPATSVEIGLSSLGANPRVSSPTADADSRFDLEHDKFPRRVSKAERREILRELREFCAAKNIVLVLIHPAYQTTVRHDCTLTKFCRRMKVPMVEAFDYLRSSDLDPKSVFVDLVHPNPRGHRLLARGLFDYLLVNDLVPK